LIKATDPTGVYNLTEVKLISFNGNILDSIPIYLVPNSGGLFMGGPVVPPDDFFNIEVERKFLFYNKIINSL
jgi:hypothetical protein